MSAVLSREESITWIDVRDQLPDVDSWVLVHAPGADEPVWLGFYDGVYWFSVDGGTYGHDEDDEIKFEVKAWAEIPRGPA